LFVSLLVAGVIVSLFFSIFIYVLALGIAAYLVLSLIASSLQVKSVKMILSVWVGIMVTHLVYGVFFLFGLGKRDLKR
jgi:hypothetical protein